MNLYKFDTVKGTYNPDSVRSERVRTSKSETSKSGMTGNPHDLVQAADVFRLVELYQIKPIGQKGIPSSFNGMGCM